MSPRPLRRHFRQTDPRASFLGTGRPLLLAVAVALFFVPGVAAQLVEPDPTIIVIRLDDVAITPVTAGYVERSIREAEDTGAVCLVIEMDTPGGLLESTRTIVKDILAAEVPIVVFVSPSGARAASAGVFITIAAHVAAMAPATHIGAAHPVSIGGVPGQPAEQDTTGSARQQGVMEDKILNDTRAWVRSLAELRGRNEEWAEQSVIESESIPSTEALELNVIDLLADDLDELVAKLDGRRVELSTGPDTIRTSDAVIRNVSMWWGERILSVLSNPNLAFMLLMLGFYGILFEFYTPGWGISGTLGAICLVLAFFGMAVLPINYAGLVLIFLAIGLFVAEAFFTSFGILTVGGAVCLVLGGLMLVDTPVPIMRVSFSVLIPVAVATALIAFFLVNRVVKAHRTQIQMGAETMVGKAAVAQGRFTAKKQRFEGMVLFQGELWRAVSPHQIEDGEDVRITDRHDLTIFVTNTQNPMAATADPRSAKRDKGTGR